MEEERIRTEEELAFDEVNLTPEDLDRIAAGLAEEQAKISHNQG